MLMDENSSSCVSSALVPSATPVIILAGFLGAGKTTLLNHVLRHAGELRLGVIVNDFGTVNVDALMVASQVDGVVGFGNGCLCCATDSDGFDDALARLARTEVDAVLVESSGIADPRSMIGRVAAMADSAVAYGGMVYVLDAGAFDSGALPPEAHRHAQVADLVVVNKADLVDRETLTGVGRWLDAVNDTAPRIVTTEGALDPLLLVDAANRSKPLGAEQLTLDSLLRDDSAAPGAHVHHDYQQYTWEPVGPVNPRAMARLLERPPAGCYRMKGWVGVESPFYSGMIEFSAVGGRIRAARSNRRGRDGVIVLIGVGMDQAVAQAACEHLAAPDPDDEFAALSLLRYDPETAAGPGPDEAEQVLE